MAIDAKTTKKKSTLRAYGTLSRVAVIIQYTVIKARLIIPSSAIFLKVSKNFGDHAMIKPDIVKISRE
jgi:hypothetical protein